MGASYFVSNGRSGLLDIILIHSGFSGFINKSKNVTALIKQNLLSLFGIVYPLLALCLGFYQCLDW